MEVMAVQARQSVLHHCTAYFKMGYEVETRKEWEK